ncbi:MAG TPA: hypothetical protein DCP69_08020 [Candidatus Omnitrophica bacterium]|nr:hypothetical protein [Candidatus Omnitrophota bacterium]
MGKRFKRERLQAAAVPAATESRMSFGDIRDKVTAALCDREGKEIYCYIVETYPDSVVYQVGGSEDLFQCSYSMEGDKVSLGEPKAVEREVTYVPLSAAGGQLMAAVGDAGSDDFGYTWRVQICKYGQAVGRAINWPREPLVAAIPLYEGARVFCLMDTQHVQAADRPCGKSVREIVGWTENVTDGGDALIGDFQILKSAKWLRDMVVDSFERGKTDLIGFSHDVTAITTTRLLAGKKVKEPVTIKSVEIDVVYSPTNEGKFIRMAAATTAGKEDSEMFEKLLVAIKTKRPDLHQQITTGMQAGTMSEDQALQMVAAATVAEAGGDAANATLVASVVSNLTAAFQVQSEPAELTEMRLLACSMRLDNELSGSLLPPAAQTNIREQFAGKVFEPATLQAAIKSTKVMVDQLTASGRVSGAGDVRVGYESGEKLQAAMDQMFGVKVADELKSIGKFSSLRAAYVEMTGDTDVTGVMTPENARRLQAAYDGATFAYALGNTLYRRVAQDYREMSDYGVSRIVGNNIRNAKDFRKLETMIIGYYGDLPTIDTDTDDYPDLGEVGDEMVEYALMEKGGVITIKRKTIINDDLRLVDKIVSRLGRGARRGLARSVWTPFLTNAIYKGDGKAIFHVDHGNLGSAAYSIPAALAGKVAMAKQVEPGSGERLMLRPVTVAYPSELFGIVKNVNNFNPQAVAVENGNAMHGFFQEAGLFENPFQTDANDWMMFADPNEIEIVELAYLNGQQEPQMFIANNPTAGQMFVNGGIQYKIQHDYNSDVIDFRGAYKSQVA